MSDNEINDIIKNIISECWNDRVKFVKHVICVTPTAQQEKMLKALDENDFVAVKSGIGIGKSALMSWIILHYMCCRSSPKIIVTSPSKDQLRSVLWGELLRWHNKMNVYFRSQFTWKKESYVHKANENWIALCRTATKDNPESMQGIHADYVTRIIDEASGINDEIFEVLEGATGIKETKEFMSGNPTRLKGMFYDAFNKNASFYKKLTFSSNDSPIASKRAIDRIKNKYGEDSNMYRVRVLGEFPVREGDSWIPYDLAFESLTRDIQSQKDMPIVFGVDPARFGSDASVVAIRQGDEFLPYHVFRQISTMELSGQVARLANQYKPSAIFVDVIGIGSGVFDRLDELGYPVIPVNVAESPAIDSKKYKRLRDELWGLARDWFEMRRGKIWDNEDYDLIGELTSIKYSFTSDGKVKIQSKDELKSSPNIADAFCLTFARPIRDYVYEKAIDEHYYNEHYYNQDREAVFALDEEAGY